MAMNVQFLKGQSSKFKAESFSPVSTTFYFLEDTKELYLGSELLTNEITLEQFNALTNRVKTLEDAGYQNASQVGAAITEALKPYAKTADIQSALDKANSALQAADLADYAKTADVVVKTTYEEHLTAQSEKDAAQDAAIKAIADDYLKAADKEALQAEIDADVKVVTDYIANHEAAWSEKTDISGLEQRMTAVEGVADAAQTAQEVSDAIDTKISALKLAETYEPIGAEQRAKDYSDTKLNAVVEQYLTGDGAADTIDTLNEIADWINSDTAGASQIIKDVAANTANINTISGDLDKVELQLNGIAAGNGTVKAAIDAVDAKFADYTKTSDLGDLATKDSLTAGEVGAYTKEEVNSAISTATTDMATNASVNSKLESYTKTADLGDLATKNLSELNLSQYAKSADLGTAAAKNVDFFATAAQGEAGVAAKAVTDTLKSAAFVDTTAFDAAGTAAGLVGVSASVENGPTGVYAAIQGATTNTVKDCVDSINAVTTQLTWGSF